MDSGIVIGLKQIQTTVTEKQNECRTLCLNLQLGLSSMNLLQAAKYWTKGRWDNCTWLCYAAEKMVEATTHGSVHKTFLKAFHKAQKVNYALRLYYCHTMQWLTPKDNTIQWLASKDTLGKKIKGKRETTSLRLKVDAFVLSSPIVKSSKRLI